MGFTRPILLASAYHLKREYWISKHIGLNAYPFPAYFATHKDPEDAWHSFLPNFENFARISIALHEFLGSSIIEDIIEDSGSSDECFLKDTSYLIKENIYER
jgi:vancomycin permeability regulator SanA